MTGVLTATRIQVNVPKAVTMTRPPREVFAAAGPYRSPYLERRQMAGDLARRLVDWQKFRSFFANAEVFFRAAEHLEGFAIVVFKPDSFLKGSDCTFPRTFGRECQPQLIVTRRSEGSELDGALIFSNGC